VSAEEAEHAVVEALHAYADAVGAAGTSDPRIVGYSFQNMVAYYLLSMVSRAFSSMPGLASGIALQIRNREIKKFIQL